MARWSWAAHSAVALLLATTLPAVSGQQYYSIDTNDAIKKSASTLAYDLMTLYTGNKTGMEPGILPGPPTENKGNYYWWQGGAMWGTLIDYWHYTGDTSYNSVVTEGILRQVGETRDFQPLAHRASLGNDDQGFWGMTVMLAAEVGFPDPPGKNDPQWLALAQAVWNTQAAPERHDKECGGGMRWQVPPINVGYNYKNTIANGCFFNLGARLARYTHNDTYAQWAEETWDWLWSVHYIDNESWKVYDGGHVEHNCTNVGKAQFSYNIGVLIQGVAFLYNHTNGAEKWKTRLEKLTEAVIRDHFADGAAFELPCEGVLTCSTDMRSFKGYLHRWMTSATQVAPFLADTVLPVLRKSAEAAIKQCTGPPSGRACGFFWTKGEYINPESTLSNTMLGTTGAGERMNVLAAVSALLVPEARHLVTNTTGGTSQGDYNAGIERHDPQTFSEITTGDRAGAGIITALMLGMSMSGFAWMSWDR